MAHSQILFGEKSQLSTFWTAPLRLEIFVIFDQVDQYRRRRKHLTAQEAWDTADAGNASFSGINKPAPTKFPVNQIMAHGLNL